MASKSSKTKSGLSAPKWSLPIADPPAAQPASQPADSKIAAKTTEAIDIIEALKTWLALGGRMGLVPDVDAAQRAAEEQLEGVRGYSYTWGVVTERAGAEDIDTPASIFWDLYLPMQQFSERGWIVGPRAQSTMANFFMDLADEFDGGLPISWGDGESHALISLMVFCDDAGAEEEARNWMAETFIPRIVPSLIDFVTRESEAYYFQLVSRLNQAA
jgi:hypothetical protein